VTGIEERLAQRQHAFTNAERRVAAWLEGSVDMVAFQTVNEVASASGVSEATIVRFARKLGFESYTSMQREIQAGLQVQFSLGDKLQKSLGAEQEHSLARAYRLDLENLRRTYERLDERDFDAAVRSIAHARRVGVVGLRASAGSATYLCFALQLVRPRVVPIRFDLDNLHEQMLDFGPGDVVLVVSVAKPAKRTLQVAHEARDRRGCSVIAIASSRVSAIASLADVVLMVSAEGTFNSYAAVSSLSGALVDGVASVLRESATARLRSLDEINSTEDVYVT
jgi:DNA-binding MurR/RpiR family transcriptional regulator